MNRCTALDQELKNTAAALQNAVCANSKLQSKLLYLENDYAGRAQAEMLSKEGSVAHLSALLVDSDIRWA